MKLLEAAFDIKNEKKSQGVGSLSLTTHRDINS